MITGHVNAMDLDLTLDGNVLAIDEISFEHYPKKSVWRTHKFTKDILLKIEKILNNIASPTKEEDTFLYDIVPIWHKRLKKYGKIDITEDEFTKSGLVYVDSYNGNKIYIRKYTDTICIDIFCVNKKVDFHIPVEAWVEILTFIKENS